jgi:hypothetical protein
MLTYAITLFAISFSHFVHSIAFSQWTETLTSLLLVTRMKFQGGLTARATERWAATGRIFVIIADPQEEQ